MLVTIIKYINFEYIILTLQYLFLSKSTKKILYIFHPKHVKSLVLISTLIKGDK